MTENGGTMREIGQLFIVEVPKQHDRNTDITCDPFNLGHKQFECRRPSHVRRERERIAQRYRRAALNRSQDHERRPCPPDPLDRRSNTRLVKVTDSSASTVA